MILNKSNTIGLLNSTPLITGNSKIIFDSNKKIYLQSINSNSFLTNSKLKAVKINPDVGYNISIQNFWSRHNQVSDDKVYDNTNLNLFNKHIKINTEQYFTENYQYFAPLFLKNNTSVPDYFIIFKTPLDYISKIPLEEAIKYPIIAYFDLKNGDFGKMIKNTTITSNTYVKDVSKINKYILYGIKYTSGSYIKGFTYYDDTYKTEDEISEDLILKFKNNKLISTNYYNLEFLFNDTTGNSIENYQGYFVNKESLGEIDFNIDKINKYFKYPININNYLNIDNTKYSISKNDGINLYTKENNYTFVNPNNIYEQFLYVINDKNNKIYSLDIDKTNNTLIHLNENNINFSNFYGLTTSDNFQIKGYPLKSRGYSNLKITLNNEFEQRQLFHHNDFLSVIYGTVNYYEFRVIANIEECCTSNEWCYYNPEHIRDVSDDIILINDENSIQLEVTFNRIHLFEEGQEIIVSANKVSNLPMIIERIEWDMKNEKTTITLIDKKGLYFHYLYNIGKIEINYHQKPYYYTYFNPLGDADYVASKIVKAFEKFPNSLKFFKVADMENQIIFIAENPGDNLYKLKLKYDITQGITSKTNFTINDKELIGTNIYNQESELMLKRYRNIINFNGESNDVKGLRFKGNKNLASTLTGDEVIQTKKGYFKLKKNYIEEHITYYSNYVEKPIMNSNILSRFANFDDYYTFQVDSEDDEIIINSHFQINTKKAFKPLLFKLNIILTENI